jgi:hypothetical protein
VLAAGCILSNGAEAQIENAAVRIETEPNALVSEVRSADPTLLSRAEQILEDRVLVRLACEEALAGSELAVHAAGDRIVLVGSVVSPLARERAGHTAAATAGVREVEERLTVADSAAAPDLPDDEDLASNVTHMLGTEFTEARAGADPLFGWHVGQGEWDFSVEVYRGTVMLIGSVPTQHDVRRAVETAWRVPGVRSVDADLVAIDREAAEPYALDGRPPPEGTEPRP